MTQAARILIVEPAPSLSHAYVGALKRDGYDMSVVEGAAAARRALAVGAGIDLLLINLQLTDGSGVELLRDLTQAGLVPRAIALTAQGSVQVAVEAMRAGAADVLLLPVGSDRLRGAVTAVLAQAPAVRDATGAAGGKGAKGRAAKPPAAAAEPAVTEYSFYGFIGASPPMKAAYRLIEAAAPSKATVFITGESGTGKEVCAEAIHRRSPRGDGPFIAINCAAIPKDLMESEIFGHVKGAFTGASTDHAGAALQADGGTLFLDEIGEMDLSLQAKLLRFLQTGMVKKVGSEKLEPVDVRIVCATNRDPYAEVQAGRFREDLFYRLQVISIELPPLRERGDDILLIARFFLEKYGKEERKAFKGFSTEAESILQTYAWPGNVRQLLNVVRNVVVLNDGDEIRPFMLPPPLNKPTMIVPPILQDPRWAAVAGPLASQLGQSFAGLAMPPTGPLGLGIPGVPIPGIGGTVPVPPPPSRPAPAEVWPDDERRIRPLWQVEEEAIDEAIRLCQGNITRAAALLEINPCTIYRRRQKKRAG
ncbi:sigma-54 dependent transcriptional regulator [Niveispirillum sp.]|uniref:sigma-54-dependent transcriptional regulator n=1 Tax=Niveispirillum sp. TaxID=1917217 RepID=UPI001B533735|nr:sigma-54 dependent transcriptional regulator [Niveispirillum sp.]MBP7334801.1 sigma-54-dependent Fis family transcriptional regulator [Niveispirillum sp.]